jgi:hypothetical protein
VRIPAGRRSGKRLWLPDAQAVVAVRDNLLLGVQQLPTRDVAHRSIVPSNVVGSITPASCPTPLSNSVPFQQYLQKRPAPRRDIVVGEANLAERVPGSATPL